MTRGIVVAGMLACAVSLFLPWEAADAPLPPGDARPQLVTGTVLAILLGLLALGYPTRMTTLFAAAVSVIPATEIGPVIRPEGEGSYGLGAFVAVGAGIVLGGVWLVEAAARAPQRSLSGAWLLMPAFGAATLAGATLPWAVVSGVGSTSGQRSVWQLLVGGEPTLPPGYLLTRVVALGVVLLAAGGTVAALVFAQRAAALAAAAACSVAAAGTLGLQLWLAITDNAVAPAEGAPGVRIAVLGFATLALLWLSQARRRGSRGGGATGADPTLAGGGTGATDTRHATADLTEDSAPATPAAAADTSDTADAADTADTHAVAASSDPDARITLRPVRHTVTGGTHRQMRQAAARSSTPLRR